MNFNPNTVILLTETDSKELKHLDSNIIDYLLENQELIPSEWKNKRIWFFGEISIRGAFAWPCVRRLHWVNNKFVAIYVGAANRRYEGMDYIPYIKS